MVQAGSGPATLGTPDSAGVPKAVAADVITVPFNNLAAFQEAVGYWGDEIAAVLVEPIVGNFGIVEPHEGFLQAVNDITHHAGALVIYDEVITAFRFTYGSAQQVYEIEPDMTAMGKIIGGGLPIGAYGGRLDINRLHHLGLPTKQEQWLEILPQWHLVLPAWKFYNRTGSMKNWTNSVLGWKKEFW